MKPETKFRKNKVLPFLKTLRRTAFFAIQQQTIRGDADYMLCVNGRYVWLELKSLDGKESALQKFKREQVLSANGIAIVADPENWADVKHWLELLSKGT